MPLYEYECNECRRRTEKIQKFSDPEITVCPYCGGLLERTLTAPNVQFKGGGWFKDLYSSARPLAANGSGGGESGESGDSGKPGAQAGASESSPSTSEKSGNGASAAPSSATPSPPAPAASTPAPAAAGASKS